MLSQPEGRHEVLHSPGIVSQPLLAGISASVDAASQLFGEGMFGELLPELFVSC